MTVSPTVVTKSRNPKTVSVTKEAEGKGRGVLGGELGDGEGEAVEVDLDGDPGDLSGILYCLTPVPSINFFIIMTRNRINAGRPVKRNFKHCLLVFTMSVHQLCVCQQCCQPLVHYQGPTDRP